MNDTLIWICCHEGNKMWKKKNIKIHKYRSTDVDQRCLGTVVKMALMQTHGLTVQEQSRQAIITADCCEVFTNVLYF